MIEKPKRPKKPDIQERQPPRTLQELVNRYDLDNTKVYDFLDGLVDLLNTREETVDTDISNLNSSVTNLSNNKVNKSGDTLTGSLYFNNADTYDAIRKKRTINNTDYQITLGLGGNASARMELVGANDTVLSSVEARSNGIYNGVSGNKLIETKSQIYYHSWHSIVLTRSDTNYLYIMLYGSNHLKEGTYSIANNFALTTYGTTSGTLTIPTSAINGITRRDWGFEVIINRSGITGITSGQYNGIAVVSAGTLTLSAT